MFINSFIVGFLKIVHPSSPKASLESLEPGAGAPGALLAKSATHLAVPGGQGGGDAIGGLFLLAPS